MYAQSQGFTGISTGAISMEIVYRDKVLRISLPPGCSLVCYANDMLIMGRDNWVEDALCAKIAAAEIVWRNRVQALGLKVALSIMETMFYRKASEKPSPINIQMETIRVEMSSRIRKYLMLILNGL